MNEKENQNPGLKKLAQELTALEKPCLSADSRGSLKKRILIRTDAYLTGDIKLAAKGPVLDMIEKARIKERIFALIEQSAQKRFIFRRYFLYQKKFVSAFLLFCMVFGFIGFVNTGVRVSRAETFTRIDEFSGEVKLERKGKVIDVYEGMEVKENDFLFTGDNGYASIKYFDDSVSRLSNETKLQINKLYKPSDSFVKTYVEVSLIEGALWSRVLNLVEEESSFVVKAKDVQFSAKKAAFNVEVEGGGVNATVYKRDVEVKGGDKVSKILKGEKVTVDTNKQIKIEQDIQGDDPVKDEWIAKNLDDDEQYLQEVEERLILAKAESVGIQTDEDFSFEKNLKEETIEFFTFDDVKKKKLELDLKEKNFLAAQVTLSKENVSAEEKEKANKAINDFKSGVTEFYGFIGEIEATDIDYAADLKQYADELILAQKKDLSIVLPDSPLYEAKRVVADLEYLGIDDPVEIAEIKNEQLKDKISDAEDTKDEKIKEAVIAEVKEEALKIAEQGPVKNVVSIKEDAGGSREVLASETSVDETGESESCANESCPHIVADVETAGVNTAVTEAGGIESAALETADIETDSEIIGETEDNPPRQDEEENYGVITQGDKNLPPLLSQ